jgi:hypothetical protein
MRYFGWLIAGFAFYKLSGVLEAMGDAAPYAAEGVSGERLQYHLGALALLIAGGACFVRAGILIWKSVRGGGSPPDKSGKSASPVEAEPEFDADAALARYLAKRDGGQAPGPTSPTGFGRRGL